MYGQKLYVQSVCPGVHKRSTLQVLNWSELWGREQKHGGHRDMHILEQEVRSASRSKGLL